MPDGVASRGLTAQTGLDRPRGFKRRSSSERWRSLNQVLSPLRRSPRLRGRAFLVSRAEAPALKSLRFSGWVRFGVSANRRRGPECPTSILPAAALR